MASQYSHLTEITQNSDLEDNKYPLPCWKINADNFHISLHALHSQLLLKSGSEQMYMPFSTLA